MWGLRYFELRTPSILVYYKGDPHFFTEARLSEGTGGVGIAGTPPQDRGGSRGGADHHGRAAERHSTAADDAGNGACLHGPRDSHCYAALASRQPPAAAPARDRERGAADSSGGSGGGSGGAAAASGATAAVDSSSSSSSSAFAGGGGGSERRTGEPPNGANGIQPSNGRQSPEAHRPLPTAEGRLALRHSSPSDGDGGSSGGSGGSAPAAAAAAAAAATGSSGGKGHTRRRVVFVGFFVAVERLDGLYRGGGEEPNPAPPGDGDSGAAGSLNAMREAVQRERRKGSLRSGVAEEVLRRAVPIVGKATVDAALDQVKRQHGKDRLAASFTVAAVDYENLNGMRVRVSEDAPEELAEHRGKCGVIIASSEETRNMGAVIVRIDGMSDARGVVIRVVIPRENLINIDEEVPAEAEAMRAVEEATKATPEAAAVAPFLALPSAPPPSSLLRPFSVSSSSSSPSSSSLDALAGAAVIDEVVCVTTAVADASIDWTQMVSAADHERLLRLLADEEAGNDTKKGNDAEAVKLNETSKKPHAVEGKTTSSTTTKTTTTTTTTTTTCRCFRARAQPIDRGDAAVSTPLCSRCSR